MLDLGGGGGREEWCQQETDRKRHRDGQRQGKIHQGDRKRARQRDRESERSTDLKPSRQTADGDRQVGPTYGRPRLPRPPQHLEGGTSQWSGQPSLSMIPSGLCCAQFIFTALKFRNFSELPVRWPVYNQQRGLAQVVI